MSEKLFGANEIEKMLQKIANEIHRNNPDDDLALIGIRARGVPLAQRLMTLLESKRKGDIHFGILDITLYRDDLSLRSVHPVVRMTEINFDVNDKTIVLVDDVLYTGRTIRSALDALVDFGRPKAIQLAVLVDRGHRQLPIQADYVGAKVQTGYDDLVEVSLKETDESDHIVVKKRNEERRESV